MTPTDLRTVRERLALTQAAFGRVLGGYSVRSVNGWEAGTTAIPAAVARLAGILGDERCPEWARTP